MLSVIVSCISSKYYEQFVQSTSDVLPFHELLCLSENIVLLGCYIIRDLSALVLTCVPSVSKVHSHYAKENVSVDIFSLKMFAQ